jgi:hypothetical protein
MAATDPSSKPSMHALVVAQEDLRAGVSRMLQRVGMVTEFADEPYAAMSELCRRPLVYRAVVLSLQGVYQEELKIVASIKRRFPHIEVYLSHTDSRQGAMAEGIRLGVDGVVSEDGVHRTGTPPAPPAAAAVAAPVAPTPPPPAPVAPGVAHMPPPVTRLELQGSEPLLTAEELRALLEDEPLVPPTVGGAR